jgi:hypothetical protein
MAECRRVDESGRLQEFDGHGHSVARTSDIRFASETKRTRIYVKSASGSDAYATASEVSGQRRRPLLSTPPLSCR